MVIGLELPRRVAIEIRIASKFIVRRVEVDEIAVGYVANALGKITAVKTNLSLLKNPSPS